MRVALGSEGAYSLDARAEDGAQLELRLARVDLMLPTTGRKLPGALSVSVKVDERARVR